MAKIAAPFAQLPDRTDPNWPGVYETVYAQLVGMGLEVPGTPANEISRADLEGHLQKLAGQLLKAELKKTDHPNYSGMTDDEQWARLHTNDLATPPPISRAFTGLPYAPNSVDIADVTNAKKAG
jgi:hypothetical protein